MMGLGAIMDIAKDAQTMFKDLGQGDFGGAMKEAADIQKDLKGEHCDKHRDCERSEHQKHCERGEHHHHRHHRFV
jgi:hypothetical protein